MNKSAQLSPGSSSEAEDDDTIEMVLSASEMQLLSEAAAQEESVETPTSQIQDGNVQSCEPLQPRLISSHRAAKIKRGVVGLVSIVAAGTVLLNGMGDSAASLRRAAAVKFESGGFVPGRRLTATAGTDPGMPVRFTNPFDPTEVFEFPTGTSEEEAHAAVADLLVNRARERESAFAKRPRGQGQRDGGAHIK
jgi:hypothetical protein